MFFLIYNINGIKKKIKCNLIVNNKGESFDNNKNVVKHNNLLYEYVIGSKEQDIFKKLLRILNLWNEFSKKHNITYWACGGTLLGAIRNCGFIPWDNDLDCCVMLSDFEKIKKLLDKHETLSYFETTFGIKIYIENVFPFLDIFICDYYDKSTIKFCGMLTNGGKPTFLISNKFPRQHIYNNELYPLKEVEFENTTIMVPNSHKCLYRAFSNKCLTNHVISDHVRRHINDNIKKHNKRLINFRKMYDIENFFHIPIKHRFTTYNFIPAKRWSIFLQDDL